MLWGEVKKFCAKDDPRLILDGFIPTLDPGFSRMKWAASIARQVVSIIVYADFVSIWEGQIKKKKELQSGYVMSDLSASDHVEETRFFTHSFHSFSRSSKVPTRFVFRDGTKFTYETETHFLERVC